MSSASKPAPDPSKPPGRGTRRPSRTSLPARLGKHLEPESPEGKPARPANTPKRPANPLDDRARLEALRDRLSALIASADTSPRDLAAVSREYRQTIAALSSLAPPATGTRLDEIAARRRKRGAS